MTKWTLLFFKKVWILELSVTTMDLILNIKIALFFLNCTSFVYFCLKNDTTWKMVIIFCYCCDFCWFYSKYIFCILINNHNCFDCYNYVKIWNISPLFMIMYVFDVVKSKLKSCRYESCLLRMSFLQCQISLKYQPAISTDLNVLDLCFFCLLESSQLCKLATIFEESRDYIFTSFCDYDTNKLFNIWIILQLIFIEFIENKGTYWCKLPHS